MKRKPFVSSLKLVEVALEGKLTLNVRSYPGTGSEVARQGGKESPNVTPRRRPVRRAVVRSGCRNLLGLISHSYPSKDSPASRTVTNRQSLYVSCGSPKGDNPTTSGSSLHHSFASFAPLAGLIRHNFRPLCSGGDLVQQTCKVPVSMTVKPVPRTCAVEFEIVVSEWLSLVRTV